MAAAMATKRKTKKSKAIDDLIPELPDLNLIETNKDNVVELEREVEQEKVVEVEKDGISEPDMQTCESEVVEMRKVDIQRMYPSLILSLSVSVESDEVALLTEEADKNSLDIVAERITRPMAPMEEWQLPEPVSEEEMRTYYRNGLLDNMERYEGEFMHEMRADEAGGGDEMDPLASLIESYERSVQRLAHAEAKLQLMRDETRGRDSSLWIVTERMGVREARCRDNVAVKKSYTWDEASYNVDEARQLEARLTRLGDELLDEHALAKYESGLTRALVEAYLVQLLPPPSLPPCPNPGSQREARRCLGVLFRRVRRVPVHGDVTCALHDWITHVSLSLPPLACAHEDRLFLLWQLLHCPPGMADWGAPLIQIDDMGLAIAHLAMLLASRKARELILASWTPSASSQDESSWALVDSDGEDDALVGSTWALLRESDLVAFLNQIPVGNIFRSVIEVDFVKDEYDPSRGCHPGLLMRVMSFCQQIVTILDAGLENYGNARYKNLNKRISRLIKHTIQFLTDHLEAVLGMSVLPLYDGSFPNNTRMQMLSQYEVIFENALISLVRHRRHGNWQCLADFPWRMLSPHRKWSCLTSLIDHHKKEIPTDNDWWLTNLQISLDSVSQDDTIYLLTTFSNIAVESRPIIHRESHLLSTITGLIFQICYVIPSTRTSFSKVGRELLSSICLQHPQALSIIIDSMKLWHPSVGQMALFLFRELPFCLMMPSDAEFKLLSLWLLDHSPVTVCNQLARHIFSNLNWGFANVDETVLYLPLSLHQRTASLLLTSFKKHAMDNRAGAWFINESIKLVTYLWWNQDAYQDQSFHAWCISLSIRLRMHPSTRYRVFDSNNLQPSFVLHSSEWENALADAQLDKCSHPVAMYMAVTTCKDSQIMDNSSLKIIHNLIVRHQQYRLCLELFYQIMTGATQVQLSILLVSDVFMNAWKLAVHADDTYYNMVKSLISKQFPGPVLGCIGSSFCPSLIIANGDKDRQEVVMKFFLQSVFNQLNWHSDQSFLWLLDKLLETNSALDLRAGSEVMHSTVKQFTDKQFSDASKRSGLAQIFRLGSSFNPLLNQLATGDYLWLKCYILEAQALVEDEIGLWSAVLHKLFIRKKREPRTVISAINGACKLLRLGLSLNINSLVVIQAVQMLATCPPDHIAIIKVAAVFFQRYLGLSRVWNKDLIGFGSAGHKIFQDDVCHPFLLQARATITSSKAHHVTQLDAFRQASSTNVVMINQMEKLTESLDMLLLWIDEPKLHLEEVNVSGLPSNYRSDLLNLARLANISMDALSFPRRFVLDQIRKSVNLWDTRHDLDYRFVRLANNLMNKPTVPLATRLLQRFKRQLSFPLLTQTVAVLFSPTVIPSQALVNTTQILEFISAPLSSLYQAAAKHRANKNFLADLDKKFLANVARQYEQQPVNQTLQMPCHRGVSCAGNAVVTLNYQTWVKRTDVIADVTRNRLDYNQLVDQIVKFSNLDQLVKGIVCLQHLIIKLDAQLALCKNEEEFKRVVDCGLVLFFHLGRQINSETQSYPPHHSFVSHTMEMIGSKFMRYSSNQASVLLKGMLENDLLVEVYGPHFIPNADTSQTSNMYIEVIEAFQSKKCSRTVACTILSKFNMKQYIEFSPSILSKLGMVDAICTAIGYTKMAKSNQMNLDDNIAEMHVGNLAMLLSGSFAVCLPRVMERFRSLLEASKLRPPFWVVVSRSLYDNIDENGELILTIEEIRIELESGGAWLSNCRFADPVCKKDGLYSKYGDHAVPIMDIYGQLLESLMFKLSRSANNNIVSWHEVVDKSWDLFLKVYIPWIQSFSSTADNQSQPELSVPWLATNQAIAETMVEKSIERLNVILTYITNSDAQSFYLHCVLIWIANGLLLPKELPSNPYHETYCTKVKRLQWTNLKPSTDCTKLISEFVSRPWICEQSKAMFIDIASQLQWNQINDGIDESFICQIFELIVVLICKTKSIFKIEATETLADTFMELNWNQLQAVNYRRGMEQLVASLEPRIILCNQSTTEGKIIKLLNHAAGSITANGTNAEQAISKQTIYVSTVVKLLSVAFSFTQNKNNKSKSSGDDNQVKLFQLRISGLFTDIEAVIIQVTRPEVSQKMAIAVLTEVIQLFKNPSIAVLATDPVIGWLQESRSSPLILPFLLALYRCGPHISSMVRLTEELIEAYILSDKSDGSAASWATITSCARLDVELQQQYWKESVRQSCMLCLVHQVLVALPSAMSSSHTEQWQTRIVDWLEQSHPQGTIAEHAAIIIIFFYLQLLLVPLKSSVKPNSAFKNMIQLLLKLSESKTSTGFLGKVGLGKRSNFSFEFRVLCRSLSVFLHGQVPTNNIFRTRPNEAGGITSADMTVPSRTMGESLPTNKTLQNLEWLKSQRVSKEMTASVKPILENNIAFICNATHTIVDCSAFVRQMCQQLWPNNKLLHIIYY